MDIKFWEDLSKNEYQIPEGHTLEGLTKTLFEYFGSTDPEARDDVAYIVYANFLKREMYSQMAIALHVTELLENMTRGIGETESDSVFLRTFSVLALAEIVHNSNKKQLLDESQIGLLLKKSLWYLDAEKDPRGHIPVKGWAHALAHTADLLLELANNSFTHRKDHEKILHGIAGKLIASNNWVYIHGEDERLAGAAIAALSRNEMTVDFFKGWLNKMTAPDTSWKGAYMDAGQAIAFHNVRNFLRSIHLEVLHAQGLEYKDEMKTILQEAVYQLKPY